MPERPYQNRFLLIFVLGLLTALGPLSIDMYLPAFSAIAKNLETDIARVGLSLSSFFVGLAVGQLIYGPLLERFGRKKPMYAGLILYMLGSVGCASATSLEMLVAFRAVQALGSCGGLVASRAIVRDLFETKEMARIFSMLIMVVAISPIIAPSLGGFIAGAFGWRPIFLVLIGLAILILLGTIFFIPETKEDDPETSLRLGPIFSNYWKILRTPQFSVYAFTGAIAYAGLYSYISGSPHLYLEVFGLSEQHYGWMFGLIAVGIISASQINNLLLKHLSSDRIVLVALSANAGIGLLLLISTLMGWESLVWTTILIFCYLACIGFTFPNASALSLDTMGNVAGKASAMMGAVQMAVGATGSAAVSYLQSSNGLSMTAIMAICSVGAFILLSQGQKNLAKRVVVES